MVSFFKMESIKIFRSIVEWYSGEFDKLEASRLIER